MSKKTKNEITLQVPPNFKLPEFYETATTKEIAEALVIGQALYATVKANTTNQEIQRIEDAKEQQIAKLKEQAEQKINVLEETIKRSEETYTALKREKQQQLQALELANREHEQEIRKTERETASRQSEQAIKALEQDLDAIKAKNDAYLTRKLELEASRDKDIQLAEERTRISLKALLDEKDRSLKQAREDLDKTNERNERAFATINEIMRNQTDEIRNLKEALVKRSSNAKTKGTAFEEAFRLKLVAAYGTSEHFALEDTAKSGFGHAGDFVMAWIQHKILWETKDYDKPVPDEEVKKFKRDMKENKEITIGVLVSRFTSITGKTSKGDFYVEFVEGKMLIYIGNFDRMSDEVLPMLMVFFKLYWHSGKKLEEDDGKINIIRQIEKLHKVLEEKKKEWRVHKSHQENSIRFTAELVEDLEHQLRCLLNDLQGIVEKVTVPDGIFRECLGDEASLQKIQTILSLTEVDPEKIKSVELNELADEYGKKRGNLTRDTAKSHIKSVILDSSFQQAKGKTAARVLGLTMRV
jgi:hypothetical protein